MLEHVRRYHPTFGKSLVRPADSCSTMLSFTSPKLLVSKPNQITPQNILESIERDSLMIERRRNSGECIANNGRIQKLDRLNRKRDQDAIDNTNKQKSLSTKKYHMEYQRDKKIAAEWTIHQVRKVHETEAELKFQLSQAKQLEIELRNKNKDLEATLENSIAMHKEELLLRDKELVNLQKYKKRKLNADKLTSTSDYVKPFHIIAHGFNGLSRATIISESWHS